MESIQSNAEEIHSDRDESQNTSELKNTTPQMPETSSSSGILINDVDDGPPKKKLHQIAPDQTEPQVHDATKSSDISGSLKVETSDTKLSKSVILQAQTQTENQTQTQYRPVNGTGKPRDEPKKTNPLFKANKYDEQKRKTDTSIISQLINRPRKSVDELFPSRQYHSSNHDNGRESISKQQNQNGAQQSRISLPKHATDTISVKADTTGESVPQNVSLAKTDNTTTQEAPSDNKNHDHARLPKEKLDDSFIFAEEEAATQPLNWTKESINKAKGQYRVRQALRSSDKIDLGKQSDTLKRLDNRIPDPIFIHDKSSRTRMIYGTFFQTYASRFE